MIAAPPLVRVFTSMHQSSDVNGAPFDVLENYGAGKHVFGKPGNGHSTVDLIHHLCPYVGTLNRLDEPPGIESFRIERVGSATAVRLRRRLPKQTIWIGKQLRIVPQGNEHLFQRYLQVPIEKLVVTFDRCVHDPAMDLRGSYWASQAELFRQQTRCHGSTDGLQFLFDLPTGLSQC